jgi:hypothetical protein
MTITIVITLVYLIPVVIVSYSAYSHNTASEKNTHKGALGRFFDMVMYIFMRSELGVAGFVTACAIHFQLYILLFVMMWCSAHVKDIADKVKQMKASNDGTYQGLELKGSEVPEMTFGGRDGRASSAPIYTLDEDSASLNSEIEETRPSLLIDS